MCEVSNRIGRRYRRGLIELRTVLALIVVLSLLPIIVQSFKLLSRYEIDYDVVNDEISLHQLRKIMLIAYDIDIHDDHLDFIYHGEDYKLELKNGRLILRPGYQIFLNNVESVNFVGNEGLLELEYKRKNYENKTYLYKEKGVYLSDFLDSSFESFDDDCSY